jgi:hypothetical protein
MYLLGAEIIPKFICEVGHRYFVSFALSHCIFVRTHRIAKNRLFGTFSSSLTEVPNFLFFGTFSSSLTKVLQLLE